MDKTFFRPTNKTATLIFNIDILQQQNIIPN